jgi:hypothetical protein
MSDVRSAWQEQITNSTDDELIKRLAVDVGEYRREYLEIAREELQRRSDTFEPHGDELRDVSIVLCK